MDHTKNKSSGSDQVENMWNNAEKLDEEDIENLDRGDEVLVKWSGGNGPIRYVLIRDKYGNPGVVSKKNWERRHKVPVVRSVLSNIGEQPLTEVRRVI